MNIPFVDLKAQYLSIRSDIDTALQHVFEQTAFIGGINPFVKQFEESFTKYLGVKHVMSCGNGTDSLEILLKAYGIGIGDEVIVPAMSWISTSEVVSAVGAKPVFVDIDPIFYTIDPSKIEAAISPRTKAIIPVHLYGQPADMDQILELSKAYQLIVIEDCAQAHAAMYKGKMVGSLANAASFSFYPGKNLGAYGDAGAMATNDDHIASLCRMIANHGQQGKHNHVMEGRNSRLDGIQAAVISSKLPHLQQWTILRQSHSQQYTDLLNHHSIITPQVRGEGEHVFHLYVIQVPDRNRLAQYLKGNNIETAVHYPVALPYLKCYDNYKHKADQFPVASSFQNKIISLPMYAELTIEAIDYISEHVKKGV
jgi:dTDP-4-amino-4,6-dideoxygalactose transaminase